MTEDPFDRLERVAESMVARAEQEDQRTRYEQQNRRGLLWVHALMGMGAGLQMLMFGSANTIETYIGLWTRPCMAALGMLGGVLLAYGLTSRPRSIPHEALGLVLVGLWDLAMTVGLGAARWDQGGFAVVPLGRPLPAGYIVAYPVTIYAGLFALICIHIWTLRQLRIEGLS